ncbi:hypothetical protein BD847_0269 [Flavobacterium cutihirudinis]|uniref:Type ISP restriction-modification enzyme LLaBIII C-terminal specificity domain-containing protein n=1 Tax=Flavobacterium cutihirudinis TaxID=1265740 RepID=A0A3D9FZF1_9FLAO|nr:type ISP restriction/modification enzyme [Flavobacterium cutihirudinis]RED26351.1 hypothetical protein BD847_0269 [Flavobacterium cutihirudinis]
MVINTFCMTIEQYLNEIKTLQPTGSIFDPELENLLWKKPSKEENDYFTIQNLFQKSENDTFVLNKEIIEKIVKGTNLLFVDKSENGNVCFANNSELRSEFRQNFNVVDLLDFCYAVLYTSVFKENLDNENKRIPIPSDSDVFWQLAKFGVRFREEKFQKK